MQEQKGKKNPYSHNVKLRLTITPVLKYRAIKFVYSVGFSATADQMV